MVWIDYAILIIITLSALVSLVRGFVKEAISLVVWIAAFFISSRYYADLSVFITALSDPLIRNAAAVLALFVCTVFLGGMVNHIIGQIVSKTGLSGTDRVLGIVFGGLRGVLIVCALLFAMDVFTGAPQSDWWQASRLVPEFKVVITWFFDLVKTSSSLIQ